MTKYAKSYIRPKTRKLIEQLKEKGVNVSITWNPEQNRISVCSMNRGEMKKKGLNVRTSVILGNQLSQICRKYNLLTRDISWLKENLLLEPSEKEEFFTALSNFDSTRGKRWRMIDKE